MRYESYAIMVKFPEKLEDMASVTLRVIAMLKLFLCQGLILRLSEAVSLIFFLLLAGCAIEPTKTITPAQQPAYDELRAVEAFYGIEAAKRVQAWRQLAHDYQNQPVLSRLNATNDFFNHLQFEDDIDHWGAEDFWATPLETVATNGGDCEDFALGKYFTLRAMGVPDQCMRMTYVKALTIDKAHMVLSYQCTASDETLILDNLVKVILPATERIDLVPVYSFNAQGLWLDTAQDYRAKQMGDAASLSRWQQLLKRVDEPLKP